MLQLALLTSLLLSCRDPADTAAPAQLPDLPTSDCGGQPYAWVDLGQMGTVLDYEQVDEWSMEPSQITSMLSLVGLEDTDRIQYAVRVYRVRYQTQDRGELAEATALLAYPERDGDVASVLYLHPTTGFEDFCAPSGRDVTWAGVPIALAGMGYAVAAPDYLGQNGFGAEAERRHPYLVAEATAVACLDSLRALWAFDESGASPSRSTLILGASQGGGAGLWSERFASEYLPDLQLLGSVLSVPMLDLITWADLATDELSVASVGLTLALASMDDWYGLGAELGEVVVEEQLARVEETMATECPKAELPEDITSLQQIFQQSFLDVADAGDLDPWSPWSCMLAESSAGWSQVAQGTGAPLMMVLGGDDQVALTGQQRAAYDTLCDEGYDVVAVECTGLGHYDSVLGSLDMQLDWIDAIAAGEDLGTPCQGITEQSCGE